MADYGGQNISRAFNVPSPYQTEQRRIEQQQKMAEMLQAQSMQPNERFSYNGIEARTPVTAGLAKMLQGFTGMMMQKKGLEEEKALGEKYRGEQSADFTNLAKMLSAPAVAGAAAVPERAAQPPTTMVDDEGNPMPGVSATAAMPAVTARRAGQIDPEMIGQFKTPEAQQMAMAQLLSQIGPEKLTEVSKGASLYSPKLGKVVFTAPTEQEYGTTPHYEEVNGVLHRFVFDKQGNAKDQGPARPLNQFTTGTVDAALKRDMDMYQFGNLSADQRASLGIRLTQAGIDVAKLGYETGLSPAPVSGLPANAPAPNFGVQTRPQAMPSQPVAPIPAQGVPRPAMPQGMPRAAIPQGTQQPAVDVTNEPRPSGVTPKAWAEIQAETAKSKISTTKDATAVLGLLTGVDALIDKAHGSGAGNIYGGLQNFVGADSSANRADAQLKVIEGALISKMPKMSGPQSDKDVLLYRQMAGEIGNPNISAQAKKDAAEIVRGIQKAYINGFSKEGYIPANRESTGQIAPAGAVRRIR
jgi:hypothetical protein